MNYYYITDPGKVRSHNEDAVNVIRNENDEYLMCVADGMGGHRGGEIASSIVIDNLTNKFNELETIGTKEEAVNWLQNVISEANKMIYEYTSSNPDSFGMGTTVVIALFTKEYLLFGNIGDSAGYVIKNGNLHKITVDHTLVNLLVKSGRLTAEEARNHPRKNVLMRALGANIKVEMDVFDVETDIDGILLCSDGLTSMLTDEQIIKVLTEDLTSQKKLEKLVIKCNNRGGNDNITIAYLNMGGVK